MKWAEVQQFESFTKMIMAITTDPVAIHVGNGAIIMDTIFRWMRKLLVHTKIYVIKYRQCFNWLLFFLIFQKWGLPVKDSWWFTLEYLDRPLCHIILNRSRSFWCKLLSSFAKDHLLLDKPSTSVTSSTLGTTHSHFFGPSSFDFTVAFL